MTFDKKEDNIINMEFIEPLTSEVMMNFIPDDKSIDFCINGEILLNISDKGFYAKDMEPIYDSGELYKLFKEFLEKANKL